MIEMSMYCKGLVMNYCLDCEIEISRNAKRCRSCSQRGPNFIEVNYCLDCGIEICNKAQRCYSCAKIGNTHAKGNKGNKLSEVTKRKMGLAKMGNTYGRGGKGNIGKKRTNETKQKMSWAQMGNTSALGHKVSKEARIRMSISKGGDGDIKRLGIKRSYKILDREWTKAILERDNYTCGLCEERGGKLEAHHIKRKAMYPKLRFKKDNGIALCFDCHNKTKKKEKRYEATFSIAVILTNIAV